MGSTETSNVSDLSSADIVDRLAIADLVARFAGAISAHDFDVASELFADGAIWSAAAAELSFRHEGRAVIRDWLSRSNLDVEVVYYAAGVPAITLLGGGRARSRVGMTEVLLIKGTGQRKLLLGTYVDELAKIEGAWRFTKRHAAINHVEDLRGAAPLPG